MRALAVLSALVSMSACAIAEKSAPTPEVAENASVDICLIAAGPLSPHNAVARAKCWADEMMGKVPSQDPAHALLSAHAQERISLAEAYEAGRLTGDGYSLALTRAEALFLLNLATVRRNAP